MELEALKKVRTPVRRSATNLIKTVQTELEKGTEMSFDIIEECLAKLLDKELSLKELDSEIEKACEIEDLEKEVEERENYKDNILTCKVRANRVLNNQKTKAEINNDNIRTANANTGENKSAQCIVNLPRLEISKYDGNILKFEDFWSQFKTAIHENKALNDIERFNYLKSYLIEEAEIAIRGLSLKSENYKVAIDVLKERFGRKDIIINAHMSKLLNLSPVKRANDTASLRKLYSDCEINIRGLENLGVEPNSYSCLLFPVILKLFPNELSLEFTRKTLNTENKIMELLTFLKTEVECREKNEFLMYQMGVRDDSSSIKNNRFQNQPVDKYNLKLENKNKKRTKNIPSAASFSTVLKSDNEYCVFHNDNSHSSKNCPLKVAERKQKLIKNGRCLLCFKRGHRFFKCYRKEMCDYGKKHHKLICDCIVSKTETENNPSMNDGTLPISPDTHCNSETKIYCASVESQNFVFLQTASAELINEEKNIPIRIFCDLGSTRSFLLSKYAIEMGLKCISREPLKVFSFGETEPKIKERESVRLKLRNPFNYEQTFCMEAILTEFITNAEISFPSKEIVNICKQTGIILADSPEISQDIEIALLIGSDFLWSFYTGKVQRFSDKLVAVETLFGTYCLSGNQNINSGDALTFHIVTKEPLKSDNILSDQIAQFWELDALGITDTVQHSKTNTDILEEFERAIKFVNNRYEVRLTWNEHSDQLNDNYEIAENRFRKLVRRFEKDPIFYDKYKSVIDKHIVEGIAEYVNIENDQDNKKLCYLPHQAVLREQKETTKLRVVFDCSSHKNNCLSLNDCLDSGPNLNPDVLGLLLQFRKNAVAIIGDIESAFLQVSLASEDRNAVRFLWLKENHEKGKPLEIQTLRMTRVLFGTTASPFLLAATLKFHIKKYELEFPLTYNTLNQHLYVDDLVAGADSPSEVLDIYKEAKHILSEGGFNMRKWRTNNKDLQNILNSAEGVEKCSNHQIKVLGYTWNPNEDTIELHLNYAESSDYKKITKRKLVSEASKIFDPCGFISPFTIRPKILMQDIWKTKIKWDDPLPSDLEEQWKNWCSELRTLKIVKIPRYYFEATEKVSNLQLHCFVDASMKNYGAVLYVRYVDLNREINVSLICSKNRVAPLKRLTLPRLELMSAVIGSRLTEYTKKYLQIFENKEIYFWTDSMIVLHWIQGGSRKLKTYVQNRVAEIKKKTDPNSWSHCPGSVNPADLLTRGISLNKLQESKLWWNGPHWLKEEKNRWPTKEINEEMEDPEEVREEISLVMNTEKKPLFEITRMSSLKKLLRVTAWVKRFIRNARNSKEKKTDPLTAEEIIAAEEFWIKITQKECFQEEIIALKDKRNLSKNSKINTLNPFLDDNEIVRVGGRLHNSNLDYSETHPIILPDKYFCELLIKDCHQRVGHSGVADTLAQVRERFWILKARQVIKRTIWNCFVCRRWKTKPFVQDVAPLPPDRIKEALPFEITGVDFLGPLYTKDQKKVYVALFTCAVVRAIHLEIVPDLTTFSFLLAFRRFISRRGLCKIMYSDNAKTFKKAEKEIKELWDLIKNPEVQEFFSERRIKWKYIIERAAWWGGFWERLVRSTKTILKKILWKSALDYQELETTLTEVEAIVNSRPLTYLYSEIGEPGPLCPGHFLVGKRLSALPAGKAANVSSSKSDITRRYKYRLVLLDRFWRKWKKEYIMDLKSAHQSDKTKSARIITKNSLVLIHEDNQPRLLWKIGMITEVHEGRDGKVRACTLRLANGNFIRRAVQHLYPLELEGTKDNSSFGAGGC